MKQNRKRKIISFMKKYGLRLWILVAFLSLSGMYTYAAYMNQQNKAKKVIVTSADSDMRFSSNYLEEGATKTKTVFMNADSTDFNVPVSIRNFGRNNPSLYYASNITYQLYVELTNTAGIDPSAGSLYNTRIENLIGEKNIRITCGETSIVLNKNNKNYTFNNQVLTYDPLAAAQNTYAVYFPDATTKICVRLVATPVPTNSYPDLQSISAILAVSDQASVKANGWMGSFNDLQTGKTPEEYDGFNYCLEGYGNSRTAKFSWNSDKLEVNKMYFEDKLNADFSSVDEEPRADGLWKTVTIELNSETSQGRYDFQLFKTTGFKNVPANPGDTPDPVTWTQLSNWVEFDDGID